MRRLLLFLLIAGIGLSVLLWKAGGLEGPRRQMAEPHVTTQADGADTSGHSFSPGPGLPNLDHAEGITQLAPPKPTVWRDRLSDETIEIPGFIPWRFLAANFRATQPPDAQRQGVLCRDVELLVYREPASRAEALALHQSADGAYEPLLHQRFTANEARVFGRLADRLRRSRGFGKEGSGHDDTTIRLNGDVQIADITQGFHITGDHVTVWPIQERAEGRGPLTLRHEAFVLRGKGMSMERVRDEGWSRFAILGDPVLRIESDVHDGTGEPVFDFGPGDFRPTHIASQGRAILVREERRRETQITVTFTDGVRAEQVGGRSLDARRVELTAVRPQPGTRVRDGSAGGNWRLLAFLADGDVAIEYPDRTRKGESYLTSVTADRLVHEVPQEGPSHTVLEGDPVILMRGEIPLLGPGGRLRASCRDRAWIGPVPADLPAADMDPTRLQHIALRGRARIERTELQGARSRDVLEGDEIDVVVLPPPEKAVAEAAAEGERMVAVYFAALGNVRLGGTRIQGSTHRLVADRLHTERPHVTAEGEGTRFRFPDLGQKQRLLGSEPGEAGHGQAGTGRAYAPPAASEEEPRWLLSRLRALGEVDIDTALGGPALGIPAQVTGDEVTYERLSNRARVQGGRAAPARIIWQAAPGMANVVETPLLVLDRGRGRVTAEGGVHGELHVARGSGRRSPFGDTGIEAGVGLDDATLSVHTDRRIDIGLSRIGRDMQPQPGAEQVIRIAGPVTAELSKDAQTIDRLRSQSLEVTLVYDVEKRSAQERPSTPAARAGTGTGSGATTPEARTPAQRFERMEIDAGDLRADVVDGKLRYVEAGGGVDMRGRDGRVSGERLTYDAHSRQVRVLAAAPDWQRRPALAWLGTDEERTEISAQVLSMTWIDGAAGRVEARVPPGAQGTVHLYRNDPGRADQLEWYALTYWDGIRMDPETIDAGRIRVIRRLREGRATAWSPSTVLWAPSLRVFGRNLLASDGSKRELRRILAQGPQTTFRSGKGEDLVEVWGHRFDFDLKTRQATLSGTPTEDVTFRKGGVSRSDQTEITIDMKTGLPTYIRGSRILWHPK